MLYHYIDLNPFSLVMVIMPVVAAILGIFVMTISKRIYLAPALSFLLPLLFITTNIKTFIANIGAWIFLGITYGLIAYATGLLVRRMKRRN